MTWDQFEVVTKAMDSGTGGGWGGRGAEADGDERKLVVVSLRSGGLVS